jgi:hypothetical protein
MWTPRTLYAASVGYMLEDVLPMEDGITLRASSATVSHRVGRVERADGRTRRYIMLTQCGHRAGLFSSGPIGALITTRDRF